MTCVSKSRISWSVPPPFYGTKPADGLYVVIFEEESNVVLP